MKHDTVSRLRAFNRFYMPAMDLLGNHYLGSEYSVPEARTLFELYTRPGCTAAHIARTMNLDKGYVSRLLKAHEKNGYLYRVASPADGRASQLYLTDRGRARAEEFIRRSDEQIAALIAPLTPEECGELDRALDTVTALLRKCGEGGNEREDRSV